MPTALIAEDEPLLAAALQAELARAWPDLRVVASVGDGLSAVREALAQRPDVLFFDIRMPGLNGLEAAAELADAWDTRERPFPALVFVTAYDQYAVEAFETAAIDYVLKPVQPARLEKSVQKLRLALAGQAQVATQTVANKDGHADDGGAATDVVFDRLRQLLASTAGAGRAPAVAGATPLRQLQVSAAGTSGNLIRMVPVDEVLFMQAADKYVRVVTMDAEHLLRTPLKDLLPQLDAAQFWQIHRSTVVRANAIESVQRDEAGKLHLSLRGHAETLGVSRLYAQLFKAL